MLDCSINDKPWFLSNKISQHSEETHPRYSICTVIYSRFFANTRAIGYDLGTSMLLHPFKIMFPSSRMSSPQVQVVLKLILYSQLRKICSVLELPTRPLVHCKFGSPSPQSSGIDDPTNPLHSKNSPVASKYDMPGKPFARLLASTGCSAGSNSVSCLQRVPFEVWRCTCLYSRRCLTLCFPDSLEYKQRDDHKHAKPPTLAALRRSSRKSCSRKSVC